MDIEEATVEFRHPVIERALASTGGRESNAGAPQAGGLEPRDKPTAFRVSGTTSSSVGPRAHVTWLFVYFKTSSLGWGARGCKLFGPFQHLQMVVENWVL